MIVKLSEEGLDINAQNKDGLTPLHIMQRKERSECIFELLILGADVNKSDGNGNTPLHFAVMVRSLEQKLAQQFDLNRRIIDIYILLGHPNHLGDLLLFVRNRRRASSDNDILFYLQCQLIFALTFLTHISSVGRQYLAITRPET